MSKYLILIIIFSTFLNCKKVNCDLIESEYKKEHFDIIVQKIYNRSSGRIFNVYGIDLNTNKKIDYYNDRTFFVEYRDYISSGDTIKKKKGEKVFFIHKKDTILKFNWECEGKIYN